MGRHLHHFYGMICHFYIQIYGPLESDSESVIVQNCEKSAKITLFWVNKRLCGTFEQFLRHFQINFSTNITSNVSMCFHEIFLMFCVISGITWAIFWAKKRNFSVSVEIRYKTGRQKWKNRRSRWTLKGPPWRTLNPKIAKWIEKFRGILI